MFDIRIDDISLVVESEYLDIEEENPSFSTDIIPGAHSFDVKFPAVPVNDKAFKFARFVEIFDKVRVYDCTIWFKGNKKWEAYLVIEEGDNNGYLGFITVNKFVIDALNSSMRSINYGADVYLGATSNDVANHAKTESEKFYPEANYAFPCVKNEGFYGSENDHFGGILNHWDFDSSAYRVNNAGNAEYNRDAMVPFLYLKFVIEKVFNHFGYHITGSWWNDSELDQVILYNNYALDRKENVYFILVGSTGNQGGQSIIVVFDDESSGLFSDDYDVYDNTTGKYTIQDIGDHNIRSTLTISINSANTTGDYTIEIIKDGSAIESISDTITANEWVEVEIETDIELTLADIGKDIWINATFTAGPGEIGGVQSGSVFQITATTQADLNRYSEYLKYSNHVPDVTIADFLIGLREFFNIKIDFIKGKKIVELSHAKNDLERSSKDRSGSTSIEKLLKIYEKKGYKLNFSGVADNLPDLSDYSSIGEFESIEDLPAPKSPDEIALVLNENAWYSVKVDLNTMKWTRLADNFYPKTIGSGDIQDLTPSFSPLKMEIAPVFAIDVDDALMPVINEKGSSSAFGLGNNDPSLRLMIYHGLQPTGVPFTPDYPFASSFNWNREGTQLGNLSFRWDDNQFGLYVKYWEPWIETLVNANEEVTMRHLMNELDLHEFDISQLMRVEDQEYLIKKVSYRLSARGIEIMETESLKNRGKWL